jgi:hypothetical protein
LKKIIAMSAFMMLLAGTVSASSINGTYKGNPIVKVTSNGTPLQVDEVPAQIVDGHTLVPISLLRQVGASVAWDGNTYSVDVQLNASKSNNKAIQVDKLTHFFNEARKEVDSAGISVENINLVMDYTGIARISYDYLPGINQTTEQSFKTVAGLLGITAAIRTEVGEAFVNVIVNDKVTDTIYANIKDCADYFDGKITADQFSKLWNYY